MAVTAALSPSSLPQSSTGRFNAESIFMRTPRFTEPIADHFGFISLRITGTDFSSAISSSPHTFRHSTAVSLVAAGVDVTVIRDWLGHASLDTTNHYARANVETKRKALEKVDPAARPGKPPRWKRNPELMAWLDSL
jgi:hypothetical protein